MNTQQLLRSFGMTAALLTTVNCQYYSDKVKPGDDSDATQKLTNAPASSGRPVPDKASGDQEVAQKDLGLLRTYWKLYQGAGTSSPAQGSSCYFLPRPDAVPSAMAECKKDSPLSKILAKYDLCVETVADPNRINHIDCGDAASISIFLHKNLVFSANGPYLFQDDRVAGCRLDSCKANPLLKDFCSYYEGIEVLMGQSKPVAAIARGDSTGELAAISLCVNELYGVAATPGGSGRNKSEPKNCSASQPDPAYSCLQDCGPPVARAGDPEPKWSWMSPADVRSRELYGCPI